jgi:serine protease
MRRLTLGLITLLLFAASLLTAIGYDPDLFYPRVIMTCFKLESIGRFDGKIDFTLKDGTVRTNMASFNELAKAYNIVDLKQAHEYVKVPTWNEEGRYLQCVYRIILADDKRMDEAAAALSKDPNVLYAELEGIMREKYVPNDPLLAQQYALDVLRCYDAWDYVTGGTNVIIGIADSGVKWNHPDLADNIWINSEEAVGVTINWAAGTFSGTNGIDDDSNGKIDDVLGWDFYGAGDNNPYQNYVGNDHGTHVAGCAGAVFDNGIGGSGTCPEVQILCCKGASNTAPMNGISGGYDQAKYAAENGACVVNASWGGQVTSLNYPNQIVNYCTNLGCLVVSAAGNDNIEHNAGYLDAPCDCPNALCVAATTISDQKTDFSDYGAPIDICAPGQAILSTVIDGDSYAAYDGTSMASPLTAGVAALVKSIHPELTALELKARLEATADWIYDENPDYAPPIAAFNMLGAGRVNAFAATMYDKIPYLVVLDSNTEELTGDGDGVPNPGELVKLNIQLTNLMDEYTGLMWMTASNVTATLSCDMAGVVVVDSVTAFGTLGAGAANWNLSDQLVFQTVSDLPSVPIPFELRLSANPTAEYPYSTVRYFNINLSLVQAGWPLNLNGASQSSACIHDLGESQDKEVIFGDQAGRIHALKSDGTELSGFPYTAAAGIIGSPAMGDINADGDLEIVANVNNQNIICLNHEGELLWTAPSGGLLVGNPIIANLNSSGAPEIVAFTQNRYIVVLTSTGSAYPNFPVQLEGAMLSSGAVADLDLDGNLEIVVSTLTGKLHAIKSSDGLSVANFPYTLGSASRNQVTIANLDGDNYPEILVPTYATSQLFAINHDGSLLWQKNIGEQVKSGAVVADVNNDGAKEIILTAYSGELYVMNASGINLAGFPVNIGQNVESTPVVARFDGSSLSGIIFGDTNGYLHSYRSDGTESANFPILISGNIKVSAAVDDIDGDGDFDIVFPNDAGFYMIDIKRAAISYQWPFYMYNISRSGNNYQSTPVTDNTTPALTTSLAANHPNPFAGETSIAYSVKHPATVSLVIYNLKGQKVKTLVGETKAAGNYSLAWNGKDDNGQPVSSGVYLYRMDTEGFSSTRKMMLMK